VVPIGFAAIFTGWRWMASMAGALLRVSARIADWHARLEPSWRVPDPPWWLAMAFVAALIGLAVAVKHRVLRWPAFLGVLGGFVLLVWHPFAPLTEPRTLEMTAIDVGQGDSLLVVFPGGLRMVVDGGGLLQFGARRRSNFDTGEDVVSPYLWSRGMRSVDIVVATHAHADHVEGLKSILENFHPGELWVGANPLPALVAHAAHLRVPVVEKRAGAIVALSGATIEVLSPPADYSAANAGNNDSLAFRIVYGSRSFLLTGDMERPMEARLLADGRAIKASVLKVGHHGSKTSTSQNFLDAVSPEVAIISDGFENSFGHPHRDVLARLKAHGMPVLRTDLDGLVTVRTDGRRLWFDTMSMRGASAWWEGERSFNWALAAGW
jgi:competence protein ComEC